MLVPIGEDTQPGDLARQVTNIILGVTHTNPRENQSARPNLPDNIPINAHTRP